MFFPVLNSIKQQNLSDHGTGQLGKPDESVSF